MLWGDVRSPRDVAFAVRSQQAVIHVAAVLPPRSEIEPERAYAVTVTGTHNVVDAVRAEATHPRLIYVSSLAVFGRTSDRAPPRRATDPVQPFDNYTRQKVEAESVVRASEVAWSILRLGAVVPIGRLAREPLLLMREMFESPLAQRIECVHAEDVALALTNAVSCDAVLGRTLLIGGGQRCQVRYRDFVQRPFEEVGIGALPAEAFSNIPYHTDWLDTAESECLLRYQAFFRGLGTRDAALGGPRADHNPVASSAVALGRAAAVALPVLIGRE
jgi:nucleoside-diphosphate-sugar epimerase